MTTSVRAGDAPTPSRGRAPWRPAVPAAASVIAAAALLLSWWRADAGPVLLGGGPPRELSPDSWTGFEVAGPRAVLLVVCAALAVGVAALGARDRDRTAARVTATRVTATAAGAVATACGGAALAGWGPTAAPGAWVALGAGLVAVGGALLPPGRTAPLLIAALVAAAATVAAPGGRAVPDRTAAGPFQRVAALGAWFPARSGAGGLSSSRGDARPVLVDGAPGVLTAAGVAVADPRGRARVLARTDDGAPPPLGVAGGRVARWLTADTLAVTGLRADDPLQVLVRDVAAAGTVGDDGSVWLHSDVDPPGTVRRLDLAAYDGRQDLSATYLPVVTIRDPDGEGPLDLRTVRPVPGGALRVAFPDPGEQIQLLTGTATGIAVRPLTRASAPPCGYPEVVGTGDVAATAADATGVWYPTPDWRLAHRDPDGTVRTVPTRLPAMIGAIAAPGDGSVLFVARDDEGSALWRLPDALAALTAPPSC